MSTQLGAQDAQFLYLQAGEVLTHVMNIAVYDPSGLRGDRLRYADLVRHVTGRCQGSPVYRRKLFRVPGDLDFPYWVDDPDFEAARHISRARLARPGGWAQFCRHAARRFAEPMDLGRPLWDLQVVEGLDAVPGVAPGSIALLQRFHHAAIDGASGAHALAALSDVDESGTPLSLPRPAGEGPATPPSAATVLGRALVSHLAAPARMAGVMLRMTPSLAAAGRRRLQSDLPPQESRVPLTRFNRRISARRSFAAVELRFDDLQAIRGAAAGSTINDVILAVCSGALREYLASHDELPAQPLVAIVPVNARRTSGQADRPGNDVTAMNVPLATSLGDPVERLRAIQRATSDAKANRAGVGVRFLADVSRRVPGLPLVAFARLLASEHVARTQGNLVITNVPTSRQPLYMAGARLTRQFGMGPVSHGLGLFISANGYHDTIAICLTADSALVPDLDHLATCVDRSFRQLRRAAAGAAGRGRGRANRGRR